MGPRAGQEPPAGQRRRWAGALESHLTAVEATKPAAVAA
jgi:hypothetical protein